MRTQLRFTPDSASASSSASTDRGDLLLLDQDLSGHLNDSLLIVFGRVAEEGIDEVSPVFILVGQLDPNAGRSMQDAEVKLLELGKEWGNPLDFTPVMMTLHVHAPFAQRNYAHQTLNEFVIIARRGCSRGGGAIR
ncbi:MAG: hypothetical protein JSS20_14580, partial [Proteobacteria bacterium]|nr:hypothetical protein [Pseudomonadota bacterium]